jgi:hypothetical protein
MPERRADGALALSLGLTPARSFADLVDERLSHHGRAGEDAAAGR